MSSVLITGTSKGIGFETVLAFGRAGHKVYATMRNPSQSPLLAETALQEKLPATVSTMDVDSDQSVSQCIAQTQRDHGPIDVLINNAGVERVGSVEELPLALPGGHGDQLFRCHPLHSGFDTAHAAAPQRLHRQCDFSSRSYVQSADGALRRFKWALEALSQALAGEMKTFNVRVAIVEPGIIDTAMARRIEDSSADSPYRQCARFAALFVASLKHPVPPSLVAQKIVEIVESGTWELRHPVGPDAAPFLQ